MRGRVVALLFLAAPVARAQVDVPAFRVVWRSPEPGRPAIEQVYAGSVDVPGEIRAVVTPVAAGRWRLDLSNRRLDPAYRIEDVHFPWVEHALGAGGTTRRCLQSPFALGGDPGDDIVLDTFVLGRGEKLVARCEYCWTAGEYPGASGAFSPLMIRTDRTSAEILAATNWDPAQGVEPRRVFTSWACNGWSLWYREAGLAPGAEASFEFLTARSTGRHAGLEPWVEVALVYQTWLRERMAAAGLYPVVYPGWLETIHGFLDVQLENEMDGRVEASVRSLWSQHKAWFPWIQFWGQMSGYGEDCCGLCRDLDRRYDRGGEFDIRAFAAEVRAAGQRVGFYSAPFVNATSGLRPHLDETGACITPRDHADPSCPSVATCDADGDGRADGEAPLDWFTRWHAVARDDWGANAYYYDTLGGPNWGRPLHVARLYGTALSTDSLTEWPVDVYPTAFLGGGALYGSPTYYPGGVGRSELEDIWDGGTDRIRFPALGTLILNDRIFFTGSANDGYRIWGLCADYWAERQAFLLGHKFDVGWPYERMSDCGDGRCPGVPACDVDAAKRFCDSGGSAVVPGGTGPSAPYCVDQALSLAIQAREAHGWWGRRPRYLHRTGISDAPPGVDLRRFDDVHGRALVVVDNWGRCAGLRFRFRGAWIAVPTERLSILEGAALTDTDADGWGDGLDNCPRMANPDQSVRDACAAPGP